LIWARASVTVPATVTVNPYRRRIKGVCGGFPARHPRTGDAYQLVAWGGRERGHEPEAYLDELPSSRMHWPLSNYLSSFSPECSQACLVHALRAKFASVGLNWTLNVEDGSSLRQQSCKLFTLNSTDLEVVRSNCKHCFRDAAQIFHVIDFAIENDPRNPGGHGCTCYLREGGAADQLKYDAIGTGCWLCLYMFQNLLALLNAVASANST
jgi:hypothetical protein